MLRGFIFQIDIRAGSHLSQPGEDEFLVIQKRRHARGQFIELFRQERLVDLEFAEPLALLRFQVIENQRNNPRQVGALELRKQRPELRRIQRSLVNDERFQGARAALVEVIGIVQRLMNKGLAGDELGIERSPADRAFAPWIPARD